MCEGMKHLQAFITSVLSTPSSSSECDIAYRPTPPNPPHPPNKQNTGSKKQRNEIKTASDCYSSTSHHLAFHWIMGRIDSLKLHSRDVKRSRSLFSALQTQIKREGENIHLKKQNPGYSVLALKTKSAYVHFTVAVQSVAICAENKEKSNMSLLFPVLNKSLPRSHSI